MTEPTQGGSQGPLPPQGETGGHQQAPDPNNRAAIEAKLQALAAEDSDSGQRRTRPTPAARAWAWFKAWNARRLDRKAEVRLRQAVEEAEQEEMGEAEGEPTRILKVQPPAETTPRGGERRRFGLLLPVVIILLAVGLVTLVLVNTARFEKQLAKVEAQLAEVTATNKKLEARLVDTEYDISRLTVYTFRKIGVLPNVVPADLPTRGGTKLRVTDSMLQPTPPAAKPPAAPATPPAAPATPPAAKPPAAKPAAPATGLPPGILIPGMKQP